MGLMDTPLGNWPDLAREVDDARAQDSEATEDPGVYLDEEPDLIEQVMADDDAMASLERRPGGPGKSPFTGWVKLNKATGEEIPIHEDRDWVPTHVANRLRDPDPARTAPQVPVAAPAAEPPPAKEQAAPPEAAADIAATGSPEERSVLKPPTPAELVALNAMRREHERRFRMTQRGWRAQRDRPGHQRPANAPQDAPAENGVDPAEPLDELDQVRKQLQANEERARQQRQQAQKQRARKLRRLSDTEVTLGNEPDLPRDPIAKTPAFQPLPGHEDHSVVNYAQAASEFADSVFFALRMHSEHIAYLRRQIENMTVGKELQDEYYT